jgi:hypothetical protein
LSQADPLAHRILYYGLAERSCESVVYRRTLRDTLLKDLGHAIKLRLNRLLALRNANGIVENSGIRVVGVSLLGRLQLVQVEHFIDDLLLFRLWLASCKGRHGSGCHRK